MTWGANAERREKMKRRKDNGDPASATGLVFDIQRFSLFDGPGIRTTVFLKGCPLQCAWCHNPEGIVPHAELLFQPEQCVGCGACVAVCPEGAHRFEIKEEARAARAAQDDAAAAGQPWSAPVGHVLERKLCTVCGACAPACPSKALELCGQRMTVGAVMAIVLRDRGYYMDSGGGLTLSGGEPLFQPAFATALLGAARAEGLHTAIETSGCGGWTDLEALLPLTDLFLYDVKETDPQRHRAFTGVPLAPILDNLRRLVAAGANVRLRLPVVPGYNDRPDHIEAVARLAQSLPGLEGADLLPYHRLGEGKRMLLGQPEDRAVSLPPDTGQVQAWKACFAAAGLDVWSAE